MYICFLHSLTLVLCIHNTLPHSYKVYAYPHMHTVPVVSNSTTSLLRSDSVSTADSLCDEIGLSPHLLDTEFPDNYSVVLAFAKLIPDWKIFADGLKLSAQEIRGIETDISLTILMQTTETLKLWKSRFGFKANYRVLLDVALDHRLENLAQKFCQVLQSELNCILRVLSTCIVKI